MKKDMAVGIVNNCKYRIVADYTKLGLRNGSSIYITDLAGNFLEAKRSKSVCHTYLIKLAEDYISKRGN